MENNLVPSVFDELEQNNSCIEYATTRQRFVNFVIDSIAIAIVVIIFSAIIGFLLARTGNSPEYIEVIFSKALFTITLRLLVSLLYYTIIEGLTKGRTLGKIITGTIAVKKDISPITIDEAFYRTLCRIIPFEPLSALGGKPWHDTMTATIVIKKRPGKF